MKLDILHYQTSIIIKSIKRTIEERELRIEREILELQKLKRELNI